MAKIKNMMLDIEHMFIDKNMSIEQIAKHFDINEKDVKIMLKYALA